MLTLTEQLSVKLIPFLFLSLTPINSNLAIEAYLSDHAVEGIVWQEVINGDIKFTKDEIKAMTAWELSILIYAVDKRNKQKSAQYSALLGGG